MNKNGRPRLGDGQLMSGGDGLAVSNTGGAPPHGITTTYPLENLKLVQKVGKKMSLCQVSNHPPHCFLEARLVPFASLDV